MSTTNITSLGIEKVYARWAPIYDLVFGAIFERGRRAVVEASERLEGRVLEVGVGTAFPCPMGADLLQVKGSWYSLEDLLRDRALAEFYRDGCFVTLRLTAGMYHRFHAPHNCRVERITHIWGDTWNVNPAALTRVSKLFCRNERVVICTRGNGARVTLVPVAAILVAGIRLRFLDLVVDPRRSSPLVLPSNISLRKGEEMGWFEHGSTIIMLAPRGVVLSRTVQPGATIRMGEALLRLART